MAFRANTPRVLLVSGLFFPDVGGPATHVRKIAEHFLSLGWQVTVLAFGDYTGSESYRVIRISRHLPRVLSWFFYATRVFVEVLRNDCAYAFDLTSSGIPTALATSVFRKPFLLRIGGDPIWERVVEKGKRFLPLRAYYETKLHLKDKPILFRALRLVVRSANSIVVYNRLFRDFYVQYFGAHPERISVIPNPFGVARENVRREADTFTFLFAGRFVLYKNLERVVRVFARVFKRHGKARLMFVGDGPEESALKETARKLGVPLTIVSKVDQTKLFELIRASSVSIAPALSEFNPNFIMETLALGKPALISRGNGLSVELPDYMQFNPEREEDIEAAMERMLDPVEYEAALTLVSSIEMDWRWPDVLSAHEELVKKVLQV